MSRDIPDIERRVANIERTLIELKLAHFVPLPLEDSIEIEGDTMTVTRPGTMTFTTLKKD